MTPNAMSRPTAAQLSNSSEGRGKPVEGRARAIGWPAWAGGATRGALSGRGSDRGVAGGLGCVAARKGLLLEAPGLLYYVRKATANGVRPYRERERNQERPKSPNLGALLLGYGLTPSDPPGEKEGLVETAKFLSYGRFKMPHSAPLEGYVPSWRYEDRSYRSWSARKDKGFFLRTRVLLDKQGNIVSANYAKVMGDFFLDAKHSCVSFAYYFNPTPNDRNLEFDPKKNLFPKDKPGSNVFEP